MTGLDDDLIEAIEDGNVALVKELLEKGADVEAVDGEGSPALLLAVDSDIEIVRMLVERGADPHRQNADKRAPREYATDPLQISYNYVDCREVVKIMDQAPELRRRFAEEQERIRQKEIEEQERIRQKKIAEKRGNMKRRASKIRIERGPEQ
jgi:ankyrin repeat protein